jgi:hypothetical protein
MNTTAERGGAGTAVGDVEPVACGVVAATVGWLAVGFDTGPGVRESTANAVTTAATPATSAPTAASSRRVVLISARIGSMTDTERIAALLHEVAETHHVVYRLTDGDDPDWASWYADWLVRLSELPDVLGSTPVRSHLVAALVQLDRDYTAAGTDESWERWYAARLPDLI